MRHVVRGVRLKKVVKSKWSGSAVRATGKGRAVSGKAQKSKPVGRTAHKDTMDPLARRVKQNLCFAPSMQGSVDYKS